MWLDNPPGATLGVTAGQSSDLPPSFCFTQTDTCFAEASKNTDGQNTPEELVAGSLPDCLSCLTRFPLAGGGEEQHVLQALEDTSAPCLVGQLVVLDQDAYTLLLATWCVNKV